MIHLVKNLFYDGYSTINEHKHKITTSHHSQETEKLSVSYGYALIDVSIPNCYILRSDSKSFSIISSVLSLIVIPML